MEKCWLWGQHPGIHHSSGNPFKLPGNNIMTPAEGAEYIGVRNCCMVVMNGLPRPPFDEYTRALQTMNQVVWSAIGSCGSDRNENDKSDIEEVIRQAEMFTNVTGAVLDDFFTVDVENFSFHKDKRARHSVESVKRIGERLHRFRKRRLDLWMVLYDYQLDYDIQDYLDLCDVITFWTWKGSNLNALDENMQKVLRRTPGRRRLAGCYMWNYGECRPMTVQQMEFQCGKYMEWMKRGWIEGIVFVSNCIFDIGLESVEWMRKWIEKEGASPF